MRRQLVLTIRTSTYTPNRQCQCAVDNARSNRADAAYASGLVRRVNVDLHNLAVGLVALLYNEVVLQSHLNQLGRRRGDVRVLGYEAQAEQQVADGVESLAPDHVQGVESA